MDKIKEAAEKLGIAPKLQLGLQVVVDGVDKNGNPKTTIKSTGAHKVKFLAEPILVMGKTFEGKPQKEYKFMVECDGFKFRWHVPVYNKDTGQPSYLLEKLMNIEVGDERILEMRSRGIIKYIDVRMIDEVPGEPPEDADQEESAD